MNKVSPKDRAKKDRELYFLNKVKAVYDDFPSGKVEALLGKDEPPDFLVSSDRGIVGIDIVDYIRGQGRAGSQVRHEDALRSKVIDAARKTFEANNNIPLLVHFHWYGPLRLVQAKKLSIYHLAADIACVVETGLIHKAYSTQRLDEDCWCGTSLDGLLAALSITRLKDKGHSLWSTVEAGFPDVSINELQTLISTHEDTFDLYLKKCTLVWLIIVADATHISSMAELPNDVREHRFRTRFGRVLFFNQLDQQVATLVGSPP